MSAPPMPLAVVLGLADTGYGVVRSLAACGIPIVAFEKNTDRSEARTRLAEVHTFVDEADLLARLVELAARATSPPALYPTSDAMVSFYSGHRQTLERLYRIDYPEASTVEMLLEKGRFASFAEEHDFAVPATFIVHSRDDVERIRERLPFPCILKPYYRKKSWHEARYPKVFRFESPDRLDAIIDEVLSVERDLILQEWIPGPDSAVYFCLTYFDESSECLAHFTGRKLRQWPVGTGSTACAEPIREDHVTDETLRLFRTCGFRGFGSVEFKRHATTGRYFITEPTVGRSNHQSYLATANGVNLQTIAYAALTGVRVATPAPPRGPVAWIDDQFDPLSIAVSLLRGRLEPGKLVRSYVGRKAFRFLNLRDPRPFLHAMLWRGPRIALRQAAARVGLRSEAS